MRNKLALMAEEIKPIDPADVASDEEVARKLATIREAAALCESPTSDLDAMLAEIEQGYELGLEFPS
jgi:uncharacterized protein YfcZ (UPF0381/DUF406 family)